MDTVLLLTAALGVAAFWLVAGLPLAWARWVARRRRMPRQARRSFGWACLLAAHGVAALAAVALLPVWAVVDTLLPWPDPAAHAWVGPLWDALTYAAFGLILVAGVVTAIMLPLKLCRVWPSMRAAAGMHARPLADPAERHG